MELKIDPEFESQFPRMTKEEFEALKKDILDYKGISEPIEVTPDGTIIDGHNRWKALQELGREDWLRTKVKDFQGNREAILRNIHAKNGLGRNLNKFQKAEAAMRYLELRKKFQPPNGGRTKNVEITAKTYGLSKRTFERAKWCLNYVANTIYPFHNIGSL